jgi:hypothetical protein
MHFKGGEWKKSHNQKARVVALSTLNREKHPEAANGKLL